MLGAPDIGGGMLEKMDLDSEGLGMSLKKLGAGVRGSWKPPDCQGQNLGSLEEQETSAFNCRVISPAPLSL